jgi:predicted nucleic acid-binding protein
LSWVVDASVALAWWFVDERTPRSEQLAARAAADRPVVPAIWPLEMANALLMAVRRGRVEMSAAQQRVAELTQVGLPIDNAGVAHLPEVLRIAQRHGLSAYDASYLELAMRLGAALATNDTALHAAARAEGVALL